LGNFIKQRVVLINPPMVADKSLINEGGIPYMPILLASVNAVLRQNCEFDVSVIDMFGMNPKNIYEFGDNIVFGENWDDITIKGRCLLFPNDIVVIFATQAICFDIIKHIINELYCFGIKNIIVAENSQHVLGFPLSLYEDDFIASGATHILCGDPEASIIDAVKGNLSEFCIKKTTDINSLPQPDWTGFPLFNYWNLEYAHAPKTSKKYISILTSRGCPNNCSFCTSPFLNGRVWRARTAGAVFDEIMFWHGMDVKEFHIEDLNPTVDKKRIKDLCQMIIDKGIFIKIKIASGTKIETIDRDTLLWMHDAGFDYLSFSPESGSEGVLYMMNKKFDHKYALNMLDFINSFRFKNPMITQACFIVGFPYDFENDKKETRKYIIELARHGLDEIALFSYVPMPGASGAVSCVNPSKASFSSKWNGNYNEMNSYKMRLTFDFYLHQIMYHPFRCMRFFRTKIWMTIKRILITKALYKEYTRSKI
jgi:anaerobic magnesium-protoporphyrin IX monomethyl ester cyclase